MMQMVLGVTSAAALFAAAYVSATLLTNDRAIAEEISHQTPDVIQVQAGTAAWSDHEICRAAVKTYFFLGSLPEDGRAVSGYDGFRSQAGNNYGCEVSGNVDAFRWVNDSGNNMNSRSTQFTVSGSRLTIITDMQREVFTN